MCGECCRTEVRPKATDYKAKIKHDGKLYTVEVPGLEIPTCDHCGERWIDIHTDEQVNISLRTAIGLLQPNEIRGRRKALGLTQKELAERVGAAESSLSRWENGSSIQARSTDRLLRMFFKHPDDSVWSGAEEAEEKPVITPLELCEKLRIEMRSFAFATVNPLEESLLGQLLLRPSELKSVSRLIRSVDFSNEMCQHIYEAMLSCFNDHHETLHEHFVGCVRDQLVKVNPKSVAFLTTFVDQVRPADNAMDIASMLRNRAMIHEQFGHISP